LGSGIIMVFDENYSFNLEVTLKTGSVVFDRHFNDIQLDNGNLTITQLSGKSYGNTLFRNVYTKQVYKFLESNNINASNQIRNYTINTTCHEVIHSFQYQYFSYDLRLNKYLYVNPFFGLTYLINNVRGYNKNVFENEANYFGNSNY
jgi:hypothetical protein